MVFEEIKKMFASQLSIDGNKILMESNIIKDLGADSLDIVELLMEVESKWGITIEDADLQGFTTVGDVVRLVEKLK